MIFNDLNYVVLTVIDRNILECYNELSHFVNQNGKNNYQITQEKLDFNQIYIKEPRAGGAHFRKFLIWEPKNLRGKTAFFSNYRDGLNTLIFQFCKKYSLKATSVNFSNQDEGGEPSYKFKYLSFSGEKLIKRVVYLIKESNKWVFYEKGEVQSFEDLSNYNNKYKTKRFNREILLRYLNKMNVDLEDESFWQSADGKADYFEQKSW